MLFILAFFGEHEMKRMITAGLLLLMLCTSATDAQQVYGEMKLTYEQGFLFAESTMPDGNTAWFAVDLAVATTSVTKAWVGDKVRIDQSQGQIKGERSKMFFALGGAGFSEDIHGKATLPLLSVGGLDFPLAAVTVMENMPEVAGRRIAGIIGADLLRRAEIAVFHYGSRPRLELKSRGRQAVDAVELPMNIIDGYILVKGEIRGKDVDVLLDTGSPESWFPVKTQRIIGASAVANSTRDLSTLEGAHIKARKSNVGDISFATKQYGRQTFGIAELPVFSRLPDHVVPVLLGNSFFSGLASVEINFSEGVVRFHS
jgi:hypothetical protein